MIPGLTAHLGDFHLVPDAPSELFRSGSMLLSGGVDIDLDATFLVQMLVFAFLIVVMKPLLYDPVLRVFALREEKTDGAKAEARTLQTRAGELLQLYEQEYERVHQVAGRERDKWRTETTKLESAVLDEARRAALGILTEGRTEIQGNVNAVRFQLGQESEKVAHELAERVLGRGVRG